MSLAAASAVASSVAIIEASAIEQLLQSIQPDRIQTLPGPVTVKPNGEWFRHTRVVYHPQSKREPVELGFIQHRQLASNEPIRTMTYNELEVASGENIGFLVYCYEHLGYRPAGEAPVRELEYPDESYRLLPY